MEEECGGVFEKANHGACGEGGHRAAGQGRAGATNSAKPDGGAPRWKGECGGVFARMDRPGASPQDTIMIADSMRNRIMARWRRCAFCMAAAHQIFWAAIEALIAIFAQLSATRAHLPEKRLTLSTVARGLSSRPEETLSTLLTQLSAISRSPAGKAFDAFHSRQRLAAPPGKNAIHPPHAAFGNARPSAGKAFDVSRVARGLPRRPRRSANRSSRAAFGNASPAGKAFDPLSGHDRFSAPPMRVHCTIKRRPVCGTAKGERRGSRSKGKMAGVGPGSGVAGGYASASGPPASA